MDIFQAAINGNIERLKELLDSGVDVNSKNYANQTPLHLAVKNSNSTSSPETVQFLLENGANIDNQTSKMWTPLMKAVRYIGKNANINGNTNNQTVKILLEYSPNLALKNTDGWTAMLIATRYGDDETIRLMLENGGKVTDTNNTNSTVLHMILRNDNVSDKYVKEFIDIFGVYIIDSKGNIPLHIASRHPRPENVKLLLEQGSDIDLQNNQGNTPLMNASKTKNLKIIKLLLENGANIFIRNNEGKTALDFCRYKVCNNLISKHMWDRMYQNIKLLSRQYSRSGNLQISKDVWELILLKQKQQQLCRNLSSHSNREILYYFALLLDLPVNEYSKKDQLCSLISKQLSYGGKYSQKSIEYFRNKDVIEDVIRSAKRLGINVDQPIDGILADMTTMLSR